MRPLVPLLALALIAGCSHRERSNPFDPGNPVTRGRPAGFGALAGSGYVQLRWAPPPLNGNFGFRVYRLSAGDSMYRTIGPDLPGSESSALDFGLANGRRNDYRLYFLFSGQLGGLPAEDHATPGSRRPWLADLGRHSLIQTTPDGRHVAFETTSFYGPTHVSVEPRSGLVWVSDTYDGRVVNLNPVSGAKVQIAGLSEPVAIAIDPIDQSAWVCDQARDAVYHYLANGSVATPSQLPTSGGADPPINTPIGIAIDPSGSTIWVCERDGNRVRRFSRAGTSLGASVVVTPSRVAIDSTNGDAWVTSFEGRAVTHLSAAGALVGTVTSVSGPIGIAVDARGGRIWVADALAGEVVALRRSGITEFRIGGLPGARDVAVDLASGEGWVTVPGNGELIRISPTGAILERLTGLSDPYGVGIDPGGRGP